MVGHVGAGGAAEDAQYYVEDRVWQGVVDAGPHQGQQHFDYLPPARAEQAYDRARYDGVAGRVEELVVAPVAVDDLRDHRHEHERGEEVRDLVVERYRLEDLEHKASPVQRDADQNQQNYPSTRHTHPFPVASVPRPAYTPGSPY
ncbi:hypothetical protein GBA63_15575 [Rubrobacter tropicus]|uniref:Uncharacterized protein n=1 Tax=Rubrobacter tropicus TaxID=2653851 RepID=A0A6G8QBM7_9ACTN|nr:hypothetical protein GBA63_15575 [Rubrobacter tropicus]